MTEDGADERAEQFHRLYLGLRIADQKAYYQARRQEYLKARDQASMLRTILLLTSAAAAAVGQLTSGDGRVGWSVAAAVLAALGGLVTAYETLMGFGQLTKVYADAAASLAEAEIDWEAAGPGGDLVGQVGRVEAAISRENGQWGQLVTDVPPLTPPAPQGGANAGGELSA